MASNVFGANLQELTSSVERASELRLQEIGAQIADQIRDYREKQGLSQSDLAKLLGTGQSRVSQMEDPQYGKFSLSSLAKAAVCLNCDLVVELRYQGGSNQPSSAVSQFARVTGETLKQNSEQLAEAIKDRPPINAEEVAHYSVPSVTQQKDNVLLPGRESGRQKWVA